MIEINLVPEEARIKGGAAKDLRNLLYLVPLIFGLLLVIHIYFFAAVSLKNYQLNLLEKRWNALEPDRKMLESLSSQQNIILQGDKIIQDLLMARVSWAEKLNKLSLNLPTGIWFNEISLVNRKFVLNGSVVSFQKEEINLINAFLDSLKNDPLFSRDFVSLELGSIQRKNIASYEVVDFVLFGELK